MLSKQANLNEYTKKYIKMILKTEDAEQLGGVINKIYEDGFEDGCNDND